MLKAHSLKNQILVCLPEGSTYRLERRNGSGGDWLVFTDSGYVSDYAEIIPQEVYGNFLDDNLFNGICQYRVCKYTDENKKYFYTAWLTCGNAEPVGYTFGNYKAPEGSWGDIITPDDLRYTYLWGIDFRASNGAAYSDAQIQFFIDAALKEVERILCITLKKTRIACEPARRNLEKGKDYDEAEPYSTFKRERVERNGYIKTKKRPILSLTRLDLINRNEKLMPLLQASTVDPLKGKILFFNRPFRTSDTQRGVETALYPHGAEQLERNLFYAIDYVAGFETSDDVPMDLRELIAKKAAVSLLNNIGRGLMAGFSSSSVSMDGVSESFSSTQSATSAFYGADIKEYKDDIDRYIAENKMKFGFIVMGAL